MRKKIVDKDGNLRYGSVLMKMMTKEGYDYPDQIRDYTGVEFIVQDDSDAEKLLKFIRRELRSMDKLEKFKGDTGKRGKHSSEKFKVIKFILRPPVKSSKVIDHPLVEEEVYERVPVEVQILSLEGHEQRKINPDAMHETYKKKQFFDFFPILFPRDIYLPFFVRDENLFLTWNGHSGLPLVGE